MSKIEFVTDDSKENSINVGRQIDFIKLLVRERDAASISLNMARQRMRDAEESYSNAEDALHDAREKLKDHLVNEGVL